MEITYRRDLNHSYVFLEQEHEIQTDAYPVRMLLSNDISGLLPCSIRGTEGRISFCYEITSRQSFQDLYEHQSIKASLLIHLFEQIFQEVEYLQQFLLPADHLVLIPELIYFDSEQKRCSFCYLPGYKKSLWESLRLLLEYLLPKIDHQNPEAVMAGYGLYRQIMEDNITLEDLKNTLQSSRSDDPPRIDPLDMEETEDIPTSSDHQELLDQIFAPEEESMPDSLSRCLGIGITVLLMLLLLIGSWMSLPIWILAAVPCAGAGGAVLFSKLRKTTSEKKSQHPDEHPEHPTFFETPSRPQAEKKAPPCSETIILPMSEKKGTCDARLSPVHPLSSPVISLNKNLILLGKLPDAADVILDSPTISRIHARIQRLGSTYYLSDLNSKNGTFLNGTPVMLGTEYPLHHGDEIRFANLVYRFYDSEPDVTS